MKTRIGDCKGLRGFLYGTGLASIPIVISFKVFRASESLISFNSKFFITKRLEILPVFTELRTAAPAINDIIKICKREEENRRTKKEFSRFSIFKFRFSEEHLRLFLAPAREKIVKMKMLFLMLVSSS